MNQQTIELILDSLWPLLKATLTGTIPLTVISFVLGLVVAVTNLSRTLDRLKQRGYWLTGLAGEGEETLYDVDLTGPLVLVMGAEGEGMRRLTRETCDRVVRIPMLGKAESLNVSAAAAVCLFEAFRQRHHQQNGKRRTG